MLKPKLFYRVVVRDAGTLEAEGAVITLEGIRRAIGGRQSARMPRAGRGPAVRGRARPYMHLIRTRAVSCKVPSSGKQTSLTARCSVGGIDLSVWMLSQGWAQPAAQAEPKLAAAADEARKKKVGLWR